MEESKISTKTLYLEIEQKYKADHINYNNFVLLLKSFKPYKELEIAGPDTYYHINGEVFRWRHSIEKDEFTIKNRISEKNLFVRKEIDLDIQNNSVRTIINFLKVLRAQKIFRIRKHCHIFWLEENNIKVSVVFYTVSCQGFKKRNFVEIESEKGQEYSKSKQAVRFWEKRLGLNLNHRINNSLYELYSGNKQFINNEIHHCGRCAKILKKEDFYLRKNGQPKGGDHCKKCYSLRDRTEYKKIYRAENKEKIKISNKVWKKNNKEKINANKRKRNKERWNSDFSYKARILLRTRISSLLKNLNIKRDKKTLEYLGCDLNQFKKYIESQFYKHKNGLPMTWENHGKKDLNWHIDHIKPLASFDLAKKQQHEEAFHYTNLRPLWSDDHLLKSIKERKTLRYRK